MIYAETERLVLRSLERADLSRLVQLLDVWEVVRWLSVLPYPYTLNDAEAFYNETRALSAGKEPEIFVLAQKTDGLLMGVSGLHAPRMADAGPGEIEIGYWLGRDYWGQGFMTEAGHELLRIGFERPSTTMIGATTAIPNKPSQAVLNKIGLRNKGVMRRTYAAQRGGDEVVRWLITRDEYDVEGTEQQVA